MEKINGNLLIMILLLGMVFGSIMEFLLHNIFTQFSKIKMILDNNKEYKIRKEEVRQMKEKGEFHEWVTVLTPSGEMMVCKKTGWCPDFEGFVPINMITAYLEKIKMEKEYKEFRNARVLELANELKLGIIEMEEIVEKVFSIKKDFTVNRLKELSADLKGKASDEDNNNTV